MITYSEEEAKEWREDVARLKSEVNELLIERGSPKRY